MIVETLARSRLYARLPETNTDDVLPKVKILARARLYEYQEVDAKAASYRMLVDTYLKPLSLEVQKRMQHFTRMQQDFEAELERKGLTFDLESCIDEVSWERENCDPGFEHEVQAFFETWGLKFRGEKSVTHLSFNVISIQHMVRYDRLTTVTIKRTKSEDRITVTVKLPI